MHRQFEELCALAATGQISGDARSVLDRHVTECSDCLAFLQDMVPLQPDVAPVVAANRGCSYPLPAGARARFLERAAAAGLKMSRDQAVALPDAPGALPPGRLHEFAVRRLAARVDHWFAGAARVAVPAAAAVACGFLGYFIAQHRYTSFPSAAGIYSSSPDPASGLGKRAAAPARGSADELPAPELQARSANAQPPASDPVLLADLASTRRRIEWLSGRLEHTQAERRLLLAQLEEVARRAAAGAQSEQQSLAGTHALQEAEGRITQLSAALEEERRKASTADAMLLAQKRATDEAYTRIADLQSQVDQASEQDLARTEAGDLISARNLQIVDVYDTDGKGKRQRSFGRVFYVEGKSLVFYAYDLNHARNARADVTFHVWGEMAGIKATTYELGIMRSDDPAQGRWTMTFNHPRVLSRINAVYVTASDTGGKISDPQGHKLLYAFLGVPHNR